MQDYVLKTTFRRKVIGYALIYMGVKILTQRFVKAV